jgi:hypothetical protein
VANNHHRPLPSPYNHIVRSSIAAPAPLLHWRCRSSKLDSWLTHLCCGKTGVLFYESSVIGFRRKALGPRTTTLSINTWQQCISDYLFNKYIRHTTNTALCLLLGSPVLYWINYRLVNYRLVSWKVVGCVLYRRKCQGPGVLVWFDSLPPIRLSQPYAHPLKYDIVHHNATVGNLNKSWYWSVFYLTRRETVTFRDFVRSWIADVQLRYFPWGVTNIFHSLNKMGVISTTPDNSRVCNSYCKSNRLISSQLRL